MRESEEEMLERREIFARWRGFRAAPYPATELTEAWKKVLFNQFHDLAAGSGIGVIYKDAQKDYDAVRWATDEATSDALHDPGQRSEHDFGECWRNPVLVFNPLAWERTDLVTADVQMPEAEKNGISVLDAQGKPLLFRCFLPVLQRTRINC